MFCVVMIGYSAIIHYGSVFWLQWWGIFLGTVFLSGCFVYHGPVARIRYHTWFRAGAPLIQLTTRLYHRASSLALESFLEIAKRDLRTPPLQSALEESAPTKELFIQLHAGYSSFWAEAHITREGRDTWTFLIIVLGHGGFLLSAILLMVSYHSFTVKVCS